MTFQIVFNLVVTFFMCQNNTTRIKSTTESMIIMSTTTISDFHLSCKDQINFNCIKIIKCVEMIANRIIFTNMIFYSWIMQSLCLFYCVLDLKQTKLQKEKTNIEKSKQEKQVKIKQSNNYYPSCTLCALLRFSSVFVSCSSSFFISRFFRCFLFSSVFYGTKCCVLFQIVD